MIALDRLGLIALLSLTACAADVSPDPEGELDEAEAIGFNAIGFNAITKNALSANQAAHVVMTKVPLATGSYDGSVPELADQLHDATTRQFMEYLVSCALEPGMKVGYVDRFDGRSYSWEGSLGVCPDWAHGPASDECRQVVSACLLARNNAFGRRIEISLRGHDEYGTALPLGPTEIADFPWREGAFFGDLFSDLHGEIDVHVDRAGTLQGSNTRVKGSIYPNMWSCWSDMWSSPQAYAQWRVCAGGSVNCAAEAVGACRASHEPGPSFVCALDDGAPEPGDGDYQDCSGANAKWSNAVSVFLHSPCDLVPTDCED